MLNYDTGVIPGALLQISQELNFNNEEMAYLSSLVYIGLCSATFFGSFMFHRFKAKWVLALMVFINSIWWLVFAMSSNIYILYVSRFILGFSQAFVVIYAPVWINEFSPPDANTRWMAGFHSACIIGIIFGYLVAQILVNYLYHYMSWRVAIHIQGVWQFLISVITIFVDNRNIDWKWLPTNESSLTDALENKQTKFSKDSSKKQNGTTKRLSALKRIDTIDEEGIGALLAQFKILWCNHVFVLVTLWLWSVYFVVTGIQFWTTAYLIVVLKVDVNTTMCLFAFVAISAPVAGVSIGSYFSDRTGGYKGENLINAVRLWTYFGLVAFIFGFPIGFIFNLFIVPLLWLLLFAGAMLIPTCTGIIVSSVPRQYQTASSSMSQLLFNLGGYFLSPVLSAYVMDKFDDHIQGFIWGYRVVLWWSVFGLIFIIITWIYVSNSEKYKQADNYNEIQDIKNVQLEISRRQAQSYSI